jgi:cytoskeleton protein RodZ
MNEQALSYEQLGRSLKNARLEKKLELAAVGRELHIRTHYLEALEEGALDTLPGDAFIGGYVGRYAKFLGLNAEEMLIAYRHLGALPPRRMFSIPAGMRSEQHPSRQLVVATLILAAAFSLAWMQLRRDGLDVMALAFSAPKLITARAIALSPACLERDIPAWPPCYAKPLRFPATGFVPRPVTSILELR